MGERLILMTSDHETARLRLPCAWHVLNKPFAAPTCQRPRLLLGRHPKILPPHEKGLIA
jgi:hypothetical protein